MFLGSKMNSFDFDHIWSNFMEMVGLNMIKYGLFGLISAIAGEQMNRLTQNFYQRLSRVKDDLTRFWPYLVKF